MDMQTTANAQGCMPPPESGCDGVDYSPKHKAGRCPRCGEWVKAYNWEPWIGAVKVRHHSCGCGRMFKSIQQDPAA